MSSRTSASAKPQVPVAPARRTRPWSLWLATAALLFLAIGALPAGFLLMTAPHGNPMGMPAALIEGTPFGALGGWLIPGIVLFTMVGLGCLFLTYALHLLPTWPWLQRLNPIKGQHWAWTLLVVEGAAIMIWILVQIALIPYSALQPTVFVLGLSLVLLAFAPSLRRRTATQPSRR
ncbi:MAG: hypothetical protein ACRC1H_08425 [Caldilineaceae bacterium]